MAIDKELLQILACPKCKGDGVAMEQGRGRTASVRPVRTCFIL